MMSHSEVAQLRHKIQLEHEAAAQGLSGLASGTARHDFIEAHMERGAVHVLQLLAEGKKQEAEALILEGTLWDAHTDEERVPCEQADLRVRDEGEEHAVANIRL
jgi:hypothetical protein